MYHSVRFRGSWIHGSGSGAQDNSVIELITDCLLSESGGVQAIPICYAHLLDMAIQWILLGVDFLSALLGFHWGLKLYIFRIGS